MLDIASLLAVSDTCKLFNQLSYEHLIQSFSSPDVTLKLSFNQEYKLKPYVDFRFSHIDKTTKNLIFKPKILKQMKFYNSAVVRKPNLYNVALMVDNNSNGEVSRLSKENFLSKTASLSIKDSGSFSKQHKLNRCSNNNPPLSYSFSYTVNATLESVKSTRAGERWITPTEFSCPVEFFYPQEDSFYKTVMNLFGKQRGNKIMSVKKLSKQKWSNSKLVAGGKRYEQQIHQSMSTPNLIIN